MKRAGLARAVTEIHNGELPFAIFLSSEGRAQGKRNGAAHDSRRRNEPGVEGDDVHGAAFTCAVAGGAAGDFCHEPLNVGPLGDGVAVGAMAAENIVVGPQQAASSHSDSLLADTQVEQTHDLTHGVERGDFFFERANEPHRAEERDELSWVLSLSCHGLCSLLGPRIVRASGAPPESPR